MANLMKASTELFRRSPDERFETLDQLYLHCQKERNASADRWHPPQALRPRMDDSRLTLTVNGCETLGLNHWSFGQLCTLCGINRETINRLSPETASRAFEETLPTSTKPLQLLTLEASVIRSIHGVTYSRLWNSELLAMLKDAAVDFEPPPKGFNGATGLYCGEQDLFTFLIDPGGWIDIGGQQFAPGFFAWNSEVGRRTLGIQAFWFQRICQNHIVWDVASDVVEFSRKHTGNIADSLGEIRRIIEALVTKRDARKDGFAALVKKAMATNVGSSRDDATKELLKYGITRDLVKRAVEKVAEDGKAFTLWNLVDALTQLTGAIQFAGDRMEADQKVAKLLAMAA